MRLVLGVVGGELGLCCLFGSLESKIQDSGLLSLLLLLTSKPLALREDPIPPYPQRHHNTYWLRCLRPFLIIVIIAVAVYCFSRFISLLALALPLLPLPLPYPILFRQPQIITIYGLGSTRASRLILLLVLLFDQTKSVRPPNFNGLLPTPSARCD